MIGIAIDSAERIVFFSNVIRSLPALRFIVISDQPIAKTLLVLKNVVQVEIAIYPKIKRGEICGDPATIVEFHREKMSPKEISLRRLALNEAFEKILQKYTIKQFFVWNGQTLVSKCIAECCEGKGIRCLFFEIGNYGGKVFADPEGVNINSALAKGKIKIPEISDKNKIECIIDKIRQAKLAPPKQSQINSLFFFLKAINAMLTPGKLFSGVNRFRRQKSPRAEIQGDRDLPSKYIFVPLQVSNDTQLLLNSTQDNFDLLQKSLSQVLDQSTKMVVKIHPAERDNEFINRVIRFRNENRNKVIISTLNTVELIERSKKVITINSTVGMEAILYNIPVETLSPTFYNSLNRSQIAWYLEEYLIDGCSYFHFENNPKPDNLTRFIVK